MRKHGEYDFTQFFKFIMNVYSKWKFYFLGAYLIWMTYSKVMTPTHMTEECYREGFMFSLKEKKEQNKQTNKQTNLRFDLLVFVHVNSNLKLEMAIHMIHNC